MWRKEKAMMVKFIWWWDTSYRENESSKKIFSFKYKALIFTMYVSSEFQQKCLKQCIF